MEILTAFITSGIVGTLVAEYYQRKMLVKITKRNFVIELFSLRHTLNQGYNGDYSEINKALGKIPIIFSDNKDVLSCYDEILTGADNKRFLRLLKAMCKDKNVKINISDWDDEMLMKTLFV